MTNHTLFEATLDDNNNFVLNVDIPGGVQINITHGNAMDLLRGLTEVIFLCAHLQRGMHNDLENKLAGSSDANPVDKEGAH